MKFLLIVFTILVVHCIEISNGEEDDPGSPGPPGAPEALTGLDRNSTDISQQIVTGEAPTVKSPSPKVSPKKAKTKKKKGEEGKEGKEKSKKKNKKENVEKKTPTTTTTTPEPPKSPKKESEEEEDQSGEKSNSGSNSVSSKEHKKPVGSTEHKSNDSKSIPEAKSQDDSPKNNSNPVAEVRVSEPGSDGKQNDSEKSQLEESPPKVPEDPKPAEWDGIRSTEAAIRSPAQDTDLPNHIPGADGRRGPELTQNIDGGYDPRDDEEIVNSIKAIQGANYPNSYDGESIRNAIPGVNGHRGGPHDYPNGYQYPSSPGYYGDQQPGYPYGIGLQDPYNRISDIGERLDGAFGHGLQNGPTNPNNVRDPSRREEDEEHNSIPGLDGQRSDGYTGPSDGGRSMFLPPGDGYPGYPGSGRGPGQYQDPQQSVPGRESGPTVGKIKPGQKSDSESDSRSDSNKDSQDSGNYATDYDTYDEEDTQAPNGSEKQQENPGKGQSGDDQSNLPDGRRQGNSPGHNDVLKPMSDKQHTNMPSGQHMGTLESGHLKGQGLSNDKGNKHNNIIQYPGDSPVFPRTDSRMYPDQDYDGNGLRNPEETRQRLKKMVESSNFGYGRGNTLWGKADDLRWNGLNALRNVITNPFGSAYNLRDSLGYGFNQFNQGIRGSDNGLYGSGGRYQIPQEVPDDNTPLSWRDFRNPRVLKKIFRYLSETLSKMQNIPRQMKDAFKRLFGYLSSSNSYE